MLLEEYIAHDATGLAALVRAGQVSPAELLDCALTLLDRLNPRINAVVVDTRDLARRDAATPPAWAAFDGVPFLVKDSLQPVAGYPMAEGSRSQAAWVPDVDGLQVERLRRAGFLIIGKTNVPEFGLIATTEPELHGPTRNPWDLERTPGGSSGGSAAAVAARMVPAAHGSDAGGSIRIPASCCGVFGLRPTRGRITDAPLHATVWGGLSSSGVLTRSVRDSAAILDLIAGTLPGDPYSVPRPLRTFRDEMAMPVGRLRVGLVREPPAQTPVDPECLAAADAAATLCTSLGHTVEELRLPADPAMVEHFMSIYASTAALCRNEAARRTGRQPVESDFEPYTWALATLGDTITGARYMAAREYCYSSARKMAKLFELYDVILSPTLGQPPVKLGELSAPPDHPLALFEKLRRFSPFTARANMIGHPAMSVPLDCTPSGLPIGVHFLGRFAAEDTLFRLAAQLESARPWVGRVPEVTKQAL